MKRGWMNELPDYNLVDQYKPIQHQTVAIDKFQELIITTLSCPGDNKMSLKKDITWLRPSYYVFIAQLKFKVHT